MDHSSYYFDIDIDNLNQVQKTFQKITYQGNNEKNSITSPH